MAKNCLTIIAFQDKTFIPSSMCCSMVPCCILLLPMGVLGVLLVDTELMNCRSSLQNICEIIDHLLRSRVIFLLMLHPLAAHGVLMNCHCKFGFCYVVFNAHMFNATEVQL
jgi:hypothetical protein